MSCTVVKMFRAEHQAFILHSYLLPVQEFSKDKLSANRLEEFPGGASNP